MTCSRSSDLGRSDRLAGVAAHPGHGGLVQVDVANPGQGELLERGAGADEAAHEVVGGFGEDAFGGVVLLDLRAGLQDRDLVAEFHGFVEVVGDEDDGLAQLFLQPQQLVLQRGRG